MVDTLESTNHIWHKRLVVNVYAKQRLLYGAICKHERRETQCIQINETVRLTASMEVYELESIKCEALIPLHTIRFS